MSHIASIDIIITDLKALQAAARELGAVWIEGRKPIHGTASQLEITRSLPA